jgi:hypothetical protein
MAIKEDADDGRMGVDSEKILSYKARGVLSIFRL